MSYQPNDFVNPHHRGVELPLGCKDLNELLQKQKGAPKLTTRQMFPLKRGNLKDIPSHVQAVYMENCGKSLVVIIRAVNTILFVHNSPGGSKLWLLQRNRPAGLGTTVPELSGITGFHEDVREGVKRFTIPLPHLWLEAAETVENVIRGCGATENAELLFYFVARAE